MRCRWPCASLSLSLLLTIQIQGLFNQQTLATWQESGWKGKKGVGTEGGLGMCCYGEQGAASPALALLPRRAKGGNGGGIAVGHVKPSRVRHWVAGRDTGSRCLCWASPGRAVRPGGWPSTSSPPLGFMLWLAGSLGGKMFPLFLQNAGFPGLAFTSPQ